MFEKLTLFSIFSSSKDNKNKKRTELKSILINSSLVILIKSMQEIESIYENAQNSIKHTLDSIPKFDDRQWHELFIDERKHAFAAIDRVDLSNPIYNKVYDRAVKNWIHGVYGVANRNNESLWEYSLRAEKTTVGYKYQIEQFKNTFGDKTSHFIKSNAIRAIRKFIETNKLREEGWKNEINIDGYSYLEDIYQRILKLENASNPVQLFDEIPIILQNFLKTYLNSSHATIADYIYDENHSMLRLGLN